MTGKSSTVYFIYAITVSSVLLLSSLPTQKAIGETYRWVDANGVVNYSERKPRGVPEEQVELINAKATPPSSDPVPVTPVPSYTPSNSSSSSTGRTSNAPAGLNSEQQALYDELQQMEQARQDKVAEIKKQNCDKARSVLTNLQQRSRIRVTMPDGTARVLPEEERQERIQQANEGIARNCE